jgi:hypothetical protein
VNCDNGIGVWHGSNGRIEAGIHDTAGNGVLCLSNTVVSVGYDGSVADITGATGTAFIDCTVGVNGRENTALHVDYCYFSGITNMALFLSQNSRCNNVESTYDTCNIAVRAEALSYWYENPGNENTFTGNTTDLLIRSMSATGGTNAGAELAGPYLVYMDPALYTTQSLTNVETFSYTFIERELGTRGRGFDLEIFGNVSGTAGTKTITVTLGATTLLTAVIAATTLEYRLRVKLVQYTATGSPVQRLSTEIHQSGVLEVIATTTPAIDFAADLELNVNHLVANAADTDRIHIQELKILH